jgi:hypothetical protein
MSFLAEIKRRKILQVAAIYAIEHVKSGELDAAYFNLNILKNNIHNDPVLKEPRFRELFDEIDATARSQ